MLRVVRRPVWSLLLDVWVLRMHPQEREREHIVVSIGSCAKVFADFYREENSPPISLFTGEVTGHGARTCPTVSLAGSPEQGLNRVSCVIRYLNIDCLLYTSPSPRDRG
eukprot:197820-Amphidinium_carterae.1